ncbi:hypothetical protein K438DRAFT_1756584 [Mycena galopus ATCC 62051]|nr:hypothetical protein K438DRAFT_1756584 [Mycena galopus ATCC 62051]
MATYKSTDGSGAWKRPSVGGPEIAFREWRADASEANASGVPRKTSLMITLLTSRTPMRERRSSRSSGKRRELGASASEDADQLFARRIGNCVPRVANGPGVSEPQDIIDGGTASFALYMIGLGASCLEWENVAYFDTTDVTSDGNATMLHIEWFAKRVQTRQFCVPLRFDMRGFVYTDARTVPSGVQLSDVITPLPVKPANVLLIMNGDTMELTGQVRLWNTTEDPTRTVSMLWDDHLGGTSNVTLSFAGVGGYVVGKYSSVWYRFNATNAAAVAALNPVAGVKSLIFLVDDVLEDQNGIGFTVQDGFIINVTRLYLTDTDGVGRVMVTEIDIAPPTEAVAANIKKRQESPKKSAPKRISRSEIAASRLGVISGAKGVNMEKIFTCRSSAPCASILLGRITKRFPVRLNNSAQMWQIIISKIVYSGPRFLHSAKYQPLTGKRRETTCKVGIQFLRSPKLIDEPVLALISTAVAAIICAGARGGARSCIVFIAHQIRNWFSFSY